MPNTYVNKVITGAGSTLIDLSQDTVTSASHIIGGRVGHLADGSSVSGTGSKTVTYSLSSGVSANVSPDSIITGEGLHLRLLAPSGYDLSNISVTMGGVDITSSVFAFDTKEEPTLATKSITANGTYTASSDSADGYSSVTVNVPSVSPTLTTKSITANGTYNASSDNVDGYSSVTVNVPSVSPTLITKSITANGTYTASSDSADGYSSVTVNVSGGGGGSKSGTYTPTQDYNSQISVKIVDISDIGFTPTRFYMWVDNVSDLSQTRYAITRVSYESFGSTPNYFRLVTRYTNTTGTLGTNNGFNSWTNRSDGQLYTDETSVYFRAHGSYRLLANVKYNWIAEA